MTAPRLVQPPVVADHHSPLRCRCPLCEVNRRIGLDESNGVAHPCDSDTRCSRPSSVTYPISKPPTPTGSGARRTSGGNAVTDQHCSPRSGPNPGSDSQPKSGRRKIRRNLSGRQHNYSDVIRSHTSMWLRDMVPLTKGAICHEQALIALLLPMPSAQNSKPAHADIRHRIPMLCGPGSCCTRPRVWATTRSRRAWTHHRRWCPSGANASTTSAWPA